MTLSEYIEKRERAWRKLEQIEKIINEWKENVERVIEMYDTLEEITKVLEQE